ncbi:hypothetical protein BDQ12DRAFT_675508 [Crucibulum laeve]|uniref:Uncharacterized protein n=1 Tax=Crucibulum laeve TaxID=68775 RepID=A0A5C3MR62_9AGAR|nr:hypothetical protein BDQ12DRAFT_675508 [Crucibulum laeve]
MGIRALLSTYGFQDLGKGRNQKTKISRQPLQLYRFHLVREINSEFFSMEFRLKLNPAALRPSEASHIKDEVERSRRSVTVRRRHCNLNMTIVFKGSGSMAVTFIRSFPSTLPLGQESLSLSCANAVRQRGSHTSPYLKEPFHASNWMPTQRCIATVRRVTCQVERSCQNAPTSRRPTWPPSRRTPLLVLHVCATNWLDCGCSMIDNSANN